ncbi:Gas vesicle synthesis protein GvpO [Rhodococcus rhodochrous J3]|uniref:Gas vesicle protein n=2 Tax=Rhodococcus rhodochrous TaxID=1829 RepID=A0AA46WWK3_RHORH|nr:gas vesicle protein GvpO [Rhodococcus rhodochrous]MBF4480462.1 gas vesicle protein [Rhodococcus rhodochrous]MCB8911536.1 gas vesicle protein [Rhodococcus rhodochrous]UZF45089.1 gas vesicle protein [Rhodococcus rhodochrous]SMG25966.1 Gas vesicle synthesis protein GvpO [Rhodococcus rhodochrous J3]
MAQDTGPPAISAAEAASAALTHLKELTSKEAQGVTSVEPTEDGWVVEVEVVEDRRIPSSADMLALYEVEIDLDGNLLAYKRTRRYGRGSSDIGARTGS